MADSRVLHKNKSTLWLIKSGKTYIQGEILWVTTILSMDDEVGSGITYWVHTKPLLIHLLAPNCYNIVDISYLDDGVGECEAFEVRRREIQLSIGSDLLALGLDFLANACLILRVVC